VYLKNNSMRTKGVGPRNLGISPLKAKKNPPVPGKALTQGFKDYRADEPKRIQESSDALNKRMANKATGGIKVDNTIESLVMGGPVVKGVTRAIKGASAAVGATRASAAVGSKVGHGIAEAAHVGEVAHSAAHMKKPKNKKK
jgi:hypothetical protein